MSVLLRLARSPILPRSRIHLHSSSSQWIHHPLHLPLPHPAASLAAAASYSQLAGLPGSSSPRNEKLWPTTTPRGSLEQIVRGFSKKSAHHGHQPHHHGDQHQHRGKKTHEEPTLESLKENPPSLLQSFMSYGKTMVVGLRQIVLDTGHSIGILVKNSDSSRREVLHLRKNKKDLIAFVPFLIIIALPGTFILMPLIFKFAPSLIPSVFRTHAMEDMINGKPEAKIEILKAFPKDLTEAFENSLAKLQKNEQQQAVLKNLQHDLQEAIHQSNRGLTYETLLKAKEVALFLSLDSFSADQLKKYTYYLGQPGFFPKRSLSRHLEFLQTDDQMLRSEGTSSLTDEEVKHALKDRGHQPFTLTHANPAELRVMLDRWLQFSGALSSRYSSLPLVAFLLRAR